MPDSRTEYHRKFNPYVAAELRRRAKPYMNYKLNDSRSLFYYSCQEWTINTVTKDIEKSENDPWCVIHDYLIKFNEWSCGSFPFSIAKDMTEWMEDELCDNIMVRKEIRRC